MKHLFYKINKPPKVLSQFIRIQKRKKTLLGELYDFPKGVMAVGRLDESSEGLLLLTTEAPIQPLDQAMTTPQARKSIHD